jgi:hypothetical protein
MQGYGEVETTPVDLEDLLHMMQRQNRKRTGRLKKIMQKPKLGHFSFTTLVIVMLVVALGTMVTVLKAEITSLKSEMSGLKDLRAQMATLDPKLEVASVESKVERKLGEANREQEKVRSELARVMASLEDLKHQKTKKTR